MRLPTLVLAGLASAPAFAHPGHIAPAGGAGAHDHVPALLAVAGAVCIVVLAKGLADVADRRAGRRRMRR